MPHLPFYYESVLFIHWSEAIETISISADNRFSRKKMASPFADRSFICYYFCSVCLCFRLLMCRLFWQSTLVIWLPCIVFGVDFFCLSEIRKSNHELLEKRCKTGNVCQLPIVVFEGIVLNKRFFSTNPERWITRLFSDTHTSRQKIIIRNAYYIYVYQGALFLRKRRANFKEKHLTQTSLINIACCSKHRPYMFVHSHTR